MLVASDLTVAQTSGGMNYMISGGISQSSMAGDKSWGANAIVFTSLDQFVVGGSITKLNLEDGKLNYINSYSSNIAYTKGSYMVINGYTKIKPYSFGTIGYNFSTINLFIKLPTKSFDQSLMTSFIVFWMKPYKTTKKMTISPQLFILNSPLSYNITNNTLTNNKNFGFVIGSTFDYKISKRFALSTSYRLTGSTQPGTPFLTNFLIGSRMTL
jgi:hypothetical protein